MHVERTGDKVFVTEPGAAADESFRHEFGVVEDYCLDDVDELYAEDGVQPRASLNYEKTVKTSSLGYKRLDIDAPPKHVTALLIRRRYIVA